MPAPLAQAVQVGIADGTVNPDANIKQLYYNSYDSILGMMQRLTVGVPSVTELDTEDRLRAICDMYVQEFAAGILRKNGSRRDRAGAHFDRGDAGRYFEIKCHTSDIYK
jgi:hypothetical protein